MNNLKSEHKKEHALTQANKYAQSISTISCKTRTCAHTHCIPYACPPTTRWGKCNFNCLIVVKYIVCCVQFVLHLNKHSARRRVRKGEKNAHNLLWTSLWSWCSFKIACSTCIKNMHSIFFLFSFRHLCDSWLFCWQRTAHSHLNLEFLFHFGFCALIFI